ncbi:GNAT family N-acetyltransferase [Agarivorans sp. Alg241-V36]|uniref:GNAT family N-acetyltransferase n=1 Tax=Agarivorans sp. Alg241-V36 TaxID=2305992 RepID=UPI0013D56658|nr:GNAT family N-acetyltransferase [Agarivorans sp. Alg241-V36]
MKLSLFNLSLAKPVTDLFEQVFSDSEGAEEGKVIGDLVTNIISSTPEQDLIGFVASSNEQVVGCIFFSRMLLASDDVAFILSPVAIATNQQGQGLGQQLINHGIEQLRKLEVNLVITYGDPNFYSKVGFNPISEQQIEAPFKLSHPEGWLAQSLSAQTIPSIEGASQCIAALNKPEYW